MFVNIVKKNALERGPPYHPEDSISSQVLAAVRKNCVLTPENPTAAVSAA